ncbi:MAG: protein-L-isoaspartate(D-aspartate) O-methyltransferase [Bacillota bacterium]
MDRNEVARQQMVKEQIIFRGIQSKPVIEAMMYVPRHLFVDADMQMFAYRDCPLPIGKNQTIPQPYMVALMTEKLNLKKTDSVLEIGTGSGYQTAILSQLSKEVFTVERLSSLQNKACLINTKLGYLNIHYLLDNGYKGWSEQAPFDKIMVTAAPRKIPEALIDQLADGGCMIIPLEQSIYDGLYLVKKENQQINYEFICSCRFVSMVDKPVGT